MLVKIPALFLGWCCLASSLNAFAPHPSILTVKYGDKMLPVVRVTTAGPYALLDGKEKLIRSTPMYLVQEADSFSDNFVQCPRGSLGGQGRTQIIGDPSFDPTGIRVGGTEFDVPLIAKETLKGGIAVTMFYTDDAYGFSPEVIVHALPDLPAGQPVRFKFRAGVLPRDMNPIFFTQIFDGAGREVLTTDVDQAWRYYAIRSRIFLFRAMQKYLEAFKGADHSAVAAIKPKPVFKPDTRKPTGDVHVVLSVKPDGTVSAVDINGVEDASVRESLTEAMSGWLFLPKLKAGVPVASKVSIPLQL